MRVAVVHDWLVSYAGSERVLEQLLHLLPEAELFAVCDFLPPGERGWLGDRRATTTFVQRLPGARRAHRSYLPLMPLAIEQLDLSGFDLVVSSSHAVAKGVLTDPDALHICYCHSPLRYAWDLQHAYLAESGLARGVRSWAARYLLHRLRQWDRASAAGVDRFVANSGFVARRIAKAYRRDADVIYPPVDVARFTPGGARSGYYVTASRFVPYKRVPMIAEAFRHLPGRELVVVGDGPQRDAVRRAAGPNVTLVGAVGDDELIRLLRGARAYLFAAVEDFGIAPIEAQATGAPVIAYRGGALAETIPALGTSARPSGVLYDAQTPEGLADGIRRFEASDGRITAEACRDNAARFSVANFRAAFTAFLETALAEHRARRPDDSDAPSGPRGAGVLSARPAIA